MPHKKNIVRDISWLAFNNRVLQEAADNTVSLKERIKFLGIFSNNLDEFFRVRVAALKKMVLLGKKAKMHLEENPQKILTQIQKLVNKQQNDFEKIWLEILEELKNKKILLVNENKLSKPQQEFVQDYFNSEVRSSIIPLMIESLVQFPVLNDKSIYLACKLSTKNNSVPKRFALVSVPVRNVQRFIKLPSPNGEHHIILLEDVIRFCLPIIFSFFGYDTFSSHIIKVTRDADIDIDNDVSQSLIQKLQKGLKNRKKGKPVRFVYDKNIDKSLLQYLTKRLGISLKENVIPGGRIHNFKDFISFPETVFETQKKTTVSFVHPIFKDCKSVTNAIIKEDVMLHFPYHSFSSVIDLLREAAIDPNVVSIKITCYRLAPKSKIIHALTNAVRNGKQVTVMLELRARFDEEANLDWKEHLEEAGVKVLLGVPNLKVHAKLCLIKRRIKNTTTHYGFISTGNLNEKTAELYGDHCLFTANRNIMADVNRVFNYLDNPIKNISALQSCKTLLVSPTNMRKQILVLINKEIKNALEKKPSGIILKLNSLSDYLLIEKLSEAALAGVKIKLIIRGICCMLTENKKFKKPIQAISIVDEYLEHARIMIFENNGNKKVYISSADWMVRNIDHRIEVACPVLKNDVQQELVEILKIQLSDTVKARKLDNLQRNEYVNFGQKNAVRSQVSTYNYLKNK